MERSSWTDLAFCLGFIEMLDSYLNIQGQPEHIRLQKKTWVTLQACQHLLPQEMLEHPERVKDFIEQFNENSPYHFLTQTMQKKVDTDNMMKQLKASTFQFQAFNPKSLGV